MKSLLKKLEETFADAALLEMAADSASGEGRGKREFRDSLEENFVEIAYAEAADYDQIHEALLQEHATGDGQVRPDDC